MLFLSILSWSMQSDTTLVCICQFGIRRLNEAELSRARSKELTAKAHWSCIKWIFQECVVIVFIINLCTNHRRICHPMISLRWRINQLQDRVTCETVQLVVFRDFLICCREFCFLLYTGVYTLISFLHFFFVKFSSDHFVEYLYMLNIHRMTFALPCVLQKPMSGTDSAEVNGVSNVVENLRSHFSKWRHYSWHVITIRRCHLDYLLDLFIIKAQPGIAIACFDGFDLVTCVP